jgi:hypothetical protein
MIVETDDYGPIDIGELEGEALADAYAESIARRGELEAIVDRHARIMARYGLDFTDTDGIVVVERVLAVARLGGAAVKRLEVDDEEEGGFG